ncbi:MAG: alpha/beta hydrolase [bacterium]
MARTAILLLLVLTGCGQLPRHTRDDGPLRFQDFPYTSATGDAWPVKRVTLSALNEAYGLPADTAITYVELNPEGKRTLVFIHGLGSYLKFWRAQLDTFAGKGYRVIAVDLPGYGKSSKPATFPYTMVAQADAVRALVQHLGLEKPTLVGHSMGGQIALTYAIRWPAEPGALVLTAPAGFEKFSAREKAWFKSVVTSAGIRAADEHAIWGSVRRGNFARWQPDLAWLIEERARVAGTDEFAAYAYANVKSIHGLLDTDFTRDSLWRIQVPTLILHGDQDRLIPNPFMHGGETREIMEVGRRGIKDAKLVTLHGCGHTVQLDCPIEYNAALSAFLGTP